MKAAVLVGHTDGLTTCCHAWRMRKLLLLLRLQAIGLIGLSPMPALSQACPYINGTQYPYWWTDVLAFADSAGSRRNGACVRKIPTTARDVSIDFPGGRAFGRWFGKGAVEAGPAQVACLPKKYVDGSNGLCGECAVLGLWAGMENPGLDLGV